MHASHQRKCSLDLVPLLGSSSKRNVARTSLGGIRKASAIISISKSLASRRSTFGFAQVSLLIPHFLLMNALAISFPETAFNIPNLRTSAYAEHMPLYQSLRQHQLVSGGRTVSRMIRTVIRPPPDPPTCSHDATPLEPRHSLPQVPPRPKSRK